MEDFNLFLLLELDPDMRWDETVFRQKLQKKKHEWSRRLQMPGKRGREAKRNLELIPKIEEAAADPSVRNEQAKAAKREQADAQQERKDAFTEALTLLQTKGYILRAELTNLEKEYADILSPAAIAKRLSVPVREEETQRKRQPSLDPSRAKEIRERLELLGEKDLYDFLGLGSSAQTQVLYQRARTLYNAAQDNSNKTQVVTLTAELSGFCLDIFNPQNASERAKYDETLRMHAYEGLKKDIDTVASVSRQISPEQVKRLLEQARQKHLDPDEALSVLQEHATSKGYAVIRERNTTEAVSELQQCGYCGNLNAARKKHCTSCGRPLREPCPQCDQPVASEEAACGNCGFPVGNRTYVQLLLRDARAAAQEHNYADAQRHVAEARQRWPKGGRDSLTSELTRVAAEIQQKKKEQTRQLEKIGRLVNERRFYTARAMLPELLQMLPPDDTHYQELKKRIADAIAQAEDRLSDARQATRTEDVIAVCQEVLAICTDCEPARDILRRTPPEPPMTLNGDVSGDVVHLNWQPSLSGPVRYTIVRKQEARPSSAADGKKIATVSGLTYDDDQPPVGVPLYYAVYADREGVLSQESAILRRPIMIEKEVTEVQASVDDGQVRLKWKPPDNVKNIVVRRSDRAFPRTPEEGVGIEVVGNSQIIDRDVENNRRYYYSVFSQFRTVQGRLRTTQGVKREATPQLPPRPITDLTIQPTGEKEQGRIQLQWTAPNKGSVVIIKSRRPTGLAVNSTLNQKHLARYGTLLETNGQQATDAVPGTGFYYYVPVVLFQGLAYVGQEQQYVALDDVSHLQVQNMGHTLRLQWRWPEKCAEVVVAYSYEGWPDLQQEQTSTETLTRAEYDLRGYFDLRNPAPADHYITVFAVARQDGERLIASGNSDGARQHICLASRITLRYEIKKTRIPFIPRKYRLEIVVEGEGPLPPLVLTRKPLTLPMHKQDGDIVVRTDERPLTESRVVLPLPDNVSRPQSFAKLFLRDDKMYSAVTIRHPSRDNLRLF